MPYVEISEFKGMDTRKPRVTGVPGTLFSLKNGHITRGAFIQRSKKFVSTFSLPAATFGFHGQGDNLFVFGGFAEPGGMPVGVTYQRLAHKTTPESTQITSILDTENFDGKIYAIAEFSDGSIFHYYDGARVTDWDDIAAALASNNSVATALKLKIDLHQSFVSTVSTNKLTIEAAVAGVGFTISATAQNFGTVNDQVITLAQVTINEVTASEVLATGSVKITGGSDSVASSGSFNLASGASGSVDGVTIDGVQIMSGAENFDTDLTTTAANVAANINAHVPSSEGGGDTAIAGTLSEQALSEGPISGAVISGLDPDYTATSSGTVVTISALVSAGAGPNGFVLNTSSTTIVIDNEVNLANGVLNALTGITVDGVSVMDGQISYDTSNSITATAIATRIGSTTSSPNYTATASGSTVIIEAIAGTGAGPNGFVILSTVAGNVLTNLVNMANGSAATVAAKEKWDATITGTFEAADVFTITLDGIDFVITGAGSGTGRTATTFKKKMYVTAQSLLYFSGINSAIVWAQIPNTEIASQIGAGFLNFANQDSGSETLRAIGIYQGNLGVFSADVTQIEFVDVDEEANTLLHTVKGTGTVAHRSVVQFGNLDLFYLDEQLGVRSLRARDSSNAPSADDVGTPIDDDILSFLATVTDQQAVDAWGMIADDGRYWLAIKNRIYVFSFFKNSKVSAWSFYEPAFNITAMVKLRKKIYLRDDADTIYQYGGVNGTTYPDAAETPLEIEFPFMDVDKAAHQKTLEAFDFAAVNTFDCNILTDPNDETVKSQTFTLNDVTYPNNRVGGLTLQSSHFAPKLVCDKAGLAELHSIAIHYQLEVPS